MSRFRWAFLWLALASCDGAGDTVDASAAGDAAAFDAGRGAAPECTNDLDCDDGIFCNGAEVCSEERCESGEAVDCADDLECTRDRCDEETARCVHEAPDGDGDGHADAACGGDDCDDEDANRYPGNVEVCDDADHDEDCDDTTYGFRDNDGDGFPAAECCNDVVEGDANCGTDCDDTLPSAHPGELETCDGFDNDCDGLTDESVTNEFFLDEDGDGFGTSDAASTAACFTPEGYAGNDDDCDDTRGFVRPGGVEVCDGNEPPLDEDCNGEANPALLCNCIAPDSRSCGDGGLLGACAAGTQECIDGGWASCSIAAVSESCDGFDQDCDGAIDETLTIRCFVDADNDTYALSGVDEVNLCPDPARSLVGGCPAGYTDRVPVGLDGDGFRQFECDDASPDVRPDAVELCNGIDDDCDFAVDEGRRVVCYVDADGDSYAASGATPMLLCPSTGEACPTGYTNREPVSGSIDCDDDEINASPAITEACNDRDDDCDGAVDEGTTVSCYADVDGDTFAPASAEVNVRCPDASTGACPTGETTRAPSDGADCDDGEAGVSPSAGEVCDGETDEDCDGLVDEALVLTCYEDLDRDGYPLADAVGSTACPTAGRCPDQSTPTPPSDGSDCDDEDATRSPGLAEQCDELVDEDCDGQVDEELALDCYTDGDGDGFTTSGATPTRLCPVDGACPSGTTATPPTTAVDCDDADSERSPGLAERCDEATDEDCDGLVDEEVALDCYVDGDGDGYPPAAATPASLCPVMGSCPSGTTAVAPSTAVDCDDENEARSPGLAEQCEGSVDEDCDGNIDEEVTLICYPDGDGDGFFPAGAVQRLLCPVAAACPSGFVPAAYGGDCNDGDGDIRPGADEVCEGSVDEDCDGSIDEELRINCYVDDDEDGYYDAAPYDDGEAVPVSECRSTGCPTGFVEVTEDGDCDDEDGTINPEADEICDGSVDEDCDTNIDEGVTIACFPNTDGDNYYGSTAAAAVEFLCPVSDTCPAGYASVTFSGDCDEASGSVYPGAAESCNGADDDCDLAVDEGTLVLCYEDTDGDGYALSDAAPQEVCPEMNGDCPAGLTDAFPGPGTTDCNDDPSMDGASFFPGAEEVCDSLDQDCDGEPDDGVQVLCYPDPDGDTYAALGTGELVCGVGADGLSCPTSAMGGANYTSTTPSAAQYDCAPDDGAINPTASEVCDDVDNDCDGLVDEGEQVGCYGDADDDGYATSDASFTLQCPGSDASDPCGPGLTDTAPVGTNIDCNDDPASGGSGQYPTASEICDLSDQDCDAEVDEGVQILCYADPDRDSYAALGTGELVCGTGPENLSCPTSADTSANYTSTTPTSSQYDCAPADTAINPAATEVCDDVDNDCDGLVDEGELVQCFVDADDDGYAVPGASFTQECPGADALDPCGMGRTNVVPVGTDVDCNDDPTMAGDEQFPGATEVCNGRDTDCDELVDEGEQVSCYADQDDDGYAAAEAAFSQRCPSGDALDPCGALLTETAPVGTDVDCNDDPATGGASQFPRATETCDLVDQDCDQVVDEGVQILCYADPDGDTFAALGTGVLLCGVGASNLECPTSGTPEDNYTSTTPTASQYDCEPSNADVNPSAAEVCNRVDEDCDGRVDEGEQVTCYEDRDDDGYARPSAPFELACASADTNDPCGEFRTDTIPIGTDSDCDDDDAVVNPGATEAQCDGADDDCDGLIDEDIQTVCFNDPDDDGYATTVALSQLVCANGPAMDPCGTNSTNVPPSTSAFDCDETSGSINSGATEVCDGFRDEDCDGFIDEALLIVCWRDNDGDGFAPEATEAVGLCPDMGGCPTGYTSTSPASGYDCNDRDATLVAEIPCYTDEDDDGFSPAEGLTVPTCDTSCGSQLTNVPPTVPDCDDGDATLAFPITCYADGDEDSYAPAGAVGAEVCASLCPTATTIVNPTSAADCDDSDSLRSPGLNEVCDGSRDEDCDLAVDEGLLVSRYVDQDDDGYGAGGIVDVCPGTPQTSTNALDCNDLNDEVHPNQTGLFYQPACPMGETVCTDSGGAFGCRAIDGSTTCRADARYWDYDCDGGIYYGPPALSCTGGVCPGGCTGTGPSYVENYTNCGRDKTNAYCGCASGSCAAYASPGTTRIFCR